MIKPTVGRTVLYHPISFLSNPEKNPSRAAIIAYVHSDSTINIAWFDENGHANHDTSVRLIQEGDEIPHHPYCEWMGYQKQVSKGEIPAVQHAS